MREETCILKGGRGDFGDLGGRGRGIMVKLVCELWSIRAKFLLHGQAFRWAGP